MHPYGYTGLSPINIVNAGTAVKAVNTVNIVIAVNFVKAFKSVPHMSCLFFSRVQAS